MVHANDRDPYVPVKVNKDGETVNLSNTSQRRGQDSTQDRAIARALSTVGPPSVSMGCFQDRSANAPLALLQNRDWNPWRTLKKTSGPWRASTLRNASKPLPACGTSSWTPSLKGNSSLTAPKILISNTMGKPESSTISPEG